MCFFIREMFFNFTYQYFMQYITYRLMKYYYFLFLCQFGTIQIQYIHVCFSNETIYVKIGMNKQ